MADEFLESLVGHGDRGGTTTPVEYRLNQEGDQCIEHGIGALGH